MEYEEHEKRAWSVDFSRTDPSMLVSGSDDCKVFGIFFLTYLEINIVQFRSLFPKLRKKSLVIFSQMSSTKITCYITTWVVDLSLLSDNSLQK